MITIYILFKLLSRAARPFIRGRTRAGAGRHKTTTRTAWKYSPPDPAKLQRIADRERLQRLKAEQAAADLIHLEQVKADLLKAYDASGAADGDSEKAIKKRIAYDNAIRKTEKQIEKAYMTLHRTY
jgi:hypothetical protein